MAKPDQKQYGCGDCGGDERADQSSQVHSILIRYTDSGVRRNEGRGEGHRNDGAAAWDRDAAVNQPDNRSDHGGDGDQRG